ncbi:MAG: metal ABC transporter permease, partial [Aquificae bacterium]|nr:metal ABC transporter permease [Aquificota bacterium]
DPFLFTAAFTVLVALLVEYLTRNKKVPGDTAIAVIFSSGMALAVLIVGISKGFGENLFSYLFGNILTVTREELLFSLFVFLLVLLYISFNYRRLILFTFSEELSRVRGVRLGLLRYSFVALTALVVVASIKAVGVVLSSSLVVIPSMTGLMVGGSFLSALLYACLAACISVLGGIFLSFSYDLPPSGAIVGVSILLFGGAFLLRRLPLK